MTKIKKDKDYFKKLGKLGGKANAKKNGKEHMRKIGKIGGKATKEKYT